MRFPADWDRRGYATHHWPERFQPLCSRQLRATPYSIGPQRADWVRVAEVEVSVGERTPATDRSGKLRGASFSLRARYLRAHRLSDHLREPALPSPDCPM